MGGTAGEPIVFGPTEVIARISGGGSRGYGGRSKFGGRAYRSGAQVRQYRHTAPTGGVYNPQQAGYAARGGGMGYGPPPPISPTFARTAIATEDCGPCNLDTPRRRPEAV